MTAQLDKICDHSVIHAVQSELKACRRAYTLVTIHKLPECRMLMTQAFTYVEYCVPYDEPNNMYWFRGSVQFKRGKAPSQWGVLYDKQKPITISLRPFFGLRYAHKPKKSRKLLQPKPKKSIDANNLLITEPSPFNLVETHA